MTIEVSSVSYLKNKKLILDEISFGIELGEILCILGPNGSGKSTLLNLISGNLSPTKGDIYIEGQNIKNISIEERAFIRSVMSQSQAIVFDFTVREIVEMGWLQRGLINFSRNFEEAFSRAINDAAIGDLIDKKFNILSGGEQRRVHFARTLLQSWRPSNSVEPKYLLLDEPTANLDIKHEQRLMKIVKKKAEDGIGVVVILHDINLAAKYSDKILILDSGTMKNFGKTFDVLNKEILEEVYDLPIEISDNPFRVIY
tara:strand:- start:3552 stop:4322 length:771 start_codon:yes stop_codon:yes gene_type:complete